MKKATFNTTSTKNHTVNPGDIILWNGSLLVALNKTPKGLLARDCNTGAGVNLGNNDKISIVRDIQIENR